MRRNAVLALAALLGAAMGTSSAQAARLKAGPLVYIMSQVPARVELDGQTIGEAPLLLNFSGLKQAQVLIVSDSGEDGFSLDIDPAQAAIAYYRPNFRPFTGFLCIRGAARQSTVSIDGGKAQRVGADPIRLPAGTHRLRIDCPARATILDDVKVELRAMAVYEAEQAPGNALVLKPVPPEGTVIGTRDSKGAEASAFVYGEAFLLPAGQTSFTMSVPGFEAPLAFKADPSKGAAVSPLEGGKGIISFPALPAGLRVLVDGKAVEASGGRLSVESGYRRISLELPGRDAYTEIVFVGGGETLEIRYP